MSIKVGINGFGRIGRLALRAAWDWPELDFVQINDPAGDAAAHAHLLNFDSGMAAGSTRRAPTATAWSSTANGEGQRQQGDRRHRLVGLRSCHRGERQDEDRCGAAAVSGAGVKRVVVSAVKEAGALNVVMGVNDGLYDPAQHRIVTAASCTTNCLAPVVRLSMSSWASATVRSPPSMT